MFDYVKNKYNKTPYLTKKSELDIKNNLYIKFLNAPYMVLPKNLEEFRSTHKSKFWYNLNRLEKLYQRDIGSLNFEIIKAPSSLNQFLDKVFILFNKKWKNEYLSTHWKCKSGFEEYKKAMIDLASTDDAFLAVLYDSDKKLLSYAYCLCDSDTVFFYQYTTDSDPKYHKYSLGKVLVYNLLKYIVNENRYKKFDFMNGEKGYKLEWAKNIEEVYIKIDGHNILSYIKYYLIKLKVYLQFNKFSRNKLKYIMKLKESFFGKCKQ